MKDKNQNIIIYNTADGKASVVLYAKDGMIWMNQNQLTELFDTSKQNIGQHIVSVLNDNELEKKSVVKNFFTTASDGKEYLIKGFVMDDERLKNPGGRPDYFDELKVLEEKITGKAL